MYNILIIGPTGVGKSALFNKIINQEIAAIGHTAKPKTLKLDDYPLTDKITLWDSPGLGEDIHKEKKYKKELEKILFKHNFIDLILIVVDGSDKSNTTISNLIKFVISLDISFQKKFIFIMNKVDIAKNYRYYWDEENNKPTKALDDHIKDFKSNYKTRLEEDTKVNISLFLHCSAELDYNLHTISNSIYHYILNKHIRER